MHANRQILDYLLHTMPSLPSNARKFLWYWLWIWPLVGLVAITWCHFDARAFESCPQVPFVFPLIGVSAAFWTWIRTFECQYLPQLFSSLILLVAGFKVFWAIT